MSKTTVALEDSVSEILSWKAKNSAASTARVRREIDRHFSRIMTLIAPRIRHFVKQYGLVAHWEDAEQVCAIAVHRAIESYDPEKAQFTTFINWMIRGELQGLRFRLMTDQRPSARKVAATTVSLNAITQPTQDEGAPPEFLIEDEDALMRTEASASDYLASAAIHSLLDSYVAHLRQVGIDQLRRRTRSVRNRPAPRHEEGPRLKINALDPQEVQQLDDRIERNHALVARRLFELPLHGDAAFEDDEGITKERMRQITKRAAKTIAAITRSDPRFAVMADKTALTPDGDTHALAPVDLPRTSATRARRLPVPARTHHEPAPPASEAPHRTVH